MNGPKYRKYRVVAEGTVQMSNANAKDVKECTWLMVDGVALKRAKITVRRVVKKDPNIPSEGHL